MPLSLLRTGANQSPKGARATDWPTIRSTTLLTADPESGARKSAFSRPAHSHISLDSTCFEVQGVSGSKPSDLPGPASRVPPRGGAAEVRHCPVPVRCPGWGSVSRSATPGPLVSRQALVYVGFEPVARLSVRTVRCKNSAMVVHFIRTTAPIATAVAGQH